MCLPTYSVTPRNRGSVIFPSRCKNPKRFLEWVINQCAMGTLTIEACIRGHVLEKGMEVEERGQINHSQAHLVDHHNAESPPPWVGAGAYGGGGPWPRARFFCNSGEGGNTPPPQKNPPSTELGPPPPLLSCKGGLPTSKGCLVVGRQGELTIRWGRGDRLAVGDIRGGARGWGFNSWASILN